MINSVQLIRVSVFLTSKSLVAKGSIDILHKKFQIKVNFYLKPFVQDALHHYDDVSFLKLKIKNTETLVQLKVEQFMVL